MTLAPGRPVAVGVLLLLALLLLAAWGCDRPPKPPIDGSDSLPPPGVDTTPPDGNGSALLEDEDSWSESIPYEITPADLAAVVPPAGPTPELRMPSPGGMVVGVYDYRPDEWCSGFMPAGAFQTPPNLVVETLKKAHDCRMKVTLNVARRMLTTTGESKGPFSMTKAKRAIDEYAAALNKVPSDARDNLLYMTVLDDMGCNSCWDGGIPKDVTAEYTRYARSKFPSWVGVGLRVDAAWMLGITNWGVDVAVNQWHKKKGPKSLSGVAKQKAWYEAARQAAAKVGVKRMIYSVNVHDCGGAPVGEPTYPCTPDELKSFVSTAINFDPAMNCGSISWKWDDSYTLKPAYQEVWKYLVNLGKSKPFLACRAT